MAKGRTILSLAAAALLAVPAAFAQGSGTGAGQAPPAPDQRSGGMMRRAPGPMMERTPGPHPDLGKWWKDSAVAAELGLSEQQVTQIEQTFLDHRLKLIDLNADVQRNEARLQPLMEADQVDEAKISAQMDQMLAARSRLEKANMMMMISIRKVLTVEQWKRLEEIRSERERTFRKMAGPDGGPGGVMRKRSGNPPPPDEY